MTSAAYGRPTAAELVAAVAEFLETDVRESTTGQVNFHSRVAANALRMVERELLADGDDHGVSEALARVGYDDEATLAAAIRAGGLDGAGERGAVGLTGSGGSPAGRRPPGLRRLANRQLRGPATEGLRVAEIG